MSIKPQKLVDDIFNRLHKCSGEPDSITAMDIRRLQNDALKLVEHDAVSAYTALGCIASLKHDTKEMLENHIRALKLAPYDYHSLVNYSVSLCNTGRYLEASDYAFKILKMTGESDVSDLQRACEHFTSAGRFITAETFASKLMDMKIEPVHKEYIFSAADLMQKNQLSEDLVSDYFVSVCKIMVERDIYPCGEILWDAFDEQYYLVREVVVDVKPEEAAEMNRELSKLVASKDIPEEILASFSSSFTAGTMPKDRTDPNAYTT